MADSHPVKHSRKRSQSVSNPQGQGPMQYPAAFVPVTQATPHFPGLPMPPMGAPYSPYPPAAWGAYPSPPSFWPPAESFEAASSLPRLHYLLAPPEVTGGTAGTHLLWDVRYKPDKCFISTDPPMKPSDEVLQRPATEPPVAKMRLISRDIPWMIIIKNPTGVTVRDVLEHLYQGLQVPFTEGEWWIAAPEERDKALQTYQHNTSGDIAAEQGRTAEGGIKRVDWLGDNTILVGISKTARDEAFLQERVTDKKVHAETWVLQLGMSAS
ncbi:hypothetical protein FRC03_006350 [Tulasnella sp. 419]|nr:hypothetical protein FRC02_005892 [Tulasnella sp. 418]KAG8960601.1 hypothetical protein FRC03_006350 [Tulasnella sp. 419]